MPIGSSFDEFLVEDGTYEEVNVEAIKRVLAWKLKQSMEDKGLSKSQLAREMKTSRPAVDRLLDPENTSVTLQTLVKAAKACQLQISFDLVAA